MSNKYNLENIKCVEILIGEEKDICYGEYFIFSNDEYDISDQLYEMINLSDIVFLYGFEYKLIEVSDEEKINFLVEFFKDRCSDH